MTIVKGILALVVLFCISLILDPVISTQIHNTPDGTVKSILIGLNYLLGMPTDIIAIFVKILFAIGISVAA